MLGHRIGEIIKCKVPDIEERAVTYTLIWCISINAGTPKATPRSDKRIGRPEG